MRCKGVVMFKGIEERAGGTFKNDKGDNIEYNKAYVIKFDEIINNKINERKLKFPYSNKSLADKFSVIRPYTQVEIECDVTLTNNASKLTPIDVKELNEDGEIEE